MVIKSTYLSIYKDTFEIFHDEEYNTTFDISKILK